MSKMLKAGCICTHLSPHTMRRPGRRNHAPAASKAWKLNQAEATRAGLVLALLKNVSPADMHRVGGSKRKLRSIIKMFEQRGHCLDAPRSGRPVKYSEAQMRTAIMYLVQHQDTLLTMPTLINQLMAEGLLHSAPDIPTFTAHLKAEVRNMGHRLNTQHTQTTFLLLDTDKSARLDYAKSMQSHLKSHPLEMLVFADETQLATGAHPKGTAQWLYANATYGNTQLARPCTPRCAQV